MKSKPRSILIESTNGDRCLAYCLACSDRRVFLDLWERAWIIIQDSILAQASQEHSKAIAHLWEADQDFQWLCYQMLALHKIDAGNLDIFQICELLFFSDSGKGLLVDLQFPTIPPGQSAPADEGDPYAKLLAMLAIKTGDWAGAKEALDNIPYDDLVNTCTELDKLYKEQSKEVAKAPKPPDTAADTAKLELIRQKVNAIHQGSVDPSMAAEQRAIEAIKMAQREGMKPGN